MGEMKEYNGVWHTFKQIKECSCGEDMRLELEEDTIGHITYKYVCKNKRCNTVLTVARTNED